MHNMCGWRSFRLRTRCLNGGRNDCRIDIFHLLSDLSCNETSHQPDRNSAWAGQRPREDSALFVTTEDGVHLARCIVKKSSTWLSLPPGAVSPLQAEHDDADPNPMNVPCSCQGLGSPQLPGGTMLIVPSPWFSPPF